MYAKPVVICFKALKLLTTDKEQWKDLLIERSAIKMSNEQICGLRQIKTEVLLICEQQTLRSAWASMKIIRMLTFSPSDKSNIQIIDFLICPWNRIVWVIIRRTKYYQKKCFPGEKKSNKKKTKKKKTKKKKKQKKNKKKHKNKLSISFDWKKLRHYANKCMQGVPPYSRITYSENNSRMLCIKTDFSNRLLFYQHFYFINLS